MMKTNPNTPSILRTLSQFSIVAAALLFSFGSLAQALFVSKYRVSPETGVSTEVSSLERETPGTGAVGW